MKSKIKISDIILCALFTAFIAVTAQLQIMTPFGVPVTLQTLGVSLCGYYLGAKKGSFSIVTYILLGTVGLPVFSGFGSGVGVLTGPTGGYIIGFIPLCILCGIGSKFKILWGIIGVVICHIWGIVHLYFISGKGVALTTVTYSLLFSAKDILLITVAHLLAERLKKALNRG